jgi:hypothetical protein
MLPVAPSVGSVWDSGASVIRPALSRAENTMIVESDSPLRRVPSTLPRHQALFLDGIRFCVEIMDLAYERLYNTAVVMTLQPANMNPRAHASVLMDSWSMIDSVHRLRALLRQMPGAAQSAKSSPKLHVFLRRTEQVEAMWHHVQHLDQEVQAIAARGEPVLGVVRW